VAISLSVHTRRIVTTQNFEQTQSRFRAALTRLCKDAYRDSSRGKEENNIHIILTISHNSMSRISHNQSQQYEQNYTHIKQFKVQRPTETEAEFKTQYLHTYKHTHTHTHTLTLVCY